MKRRVLYISIFIIAVFGLLYIQNQYLKIGLNLARVQFNKKALAAEERIQQDLSYNNKLTFLLLNAIDKDTYFGLSHDSIKKVSNFFLKGFLQDKLSSEGIDTEFSYRLYTRDSIDFLRSSLKTSNVDELLLYPIEIKGFLTEELDQPLILELQFQDINKYFFSQINGLYYPSILFMIIIVAVVIWVLYSFYWQSNIITSKNEFLNNLTHELRTPIFSIGLATKMLEESADANKQELINVIRQQIKRLKNQTDQVLELASIESAKVLALTVDDVRPLLIEICNDFNSISQLENFEFSFYIEDSNFCIANETVHFENAIYQILDNAKKYSENPKIELHATSSEDQLIIKITDNGIGISAKEQKKIFQKFYKANRINADRTKGYGLGLAYVKQIVTKHHGKIMVESKVDQGTTMLLKFPLRSC